MWWSWLLEIPLFFLAFVLPVLYLIRGSHPLHPRRSRRFRGERVPFSVAIEKERDALRETRRTSPTPSRTLHKDRA